jgi:hypothetical protein
MFKTLGSMQTFHNSEFPMEIRAMQNTHNDVHAAFLMEAKLENPHVQQQPANYRAPKGHKVAPMKCL